MGKYINLSKPPGATTPDSPHITNKHLKPVSLTIVFLSLILGFCVLGASSLFLNEVKQTEGAPHAGPTTNTSFYIGITTLGIFAVSLQLCASTTFWIIKDREARRSMLTFAIVQSVIQTVLLICVILILTKLSDAEIYGGSSDASSTSSTSAKPIFAGTSSTGHGFWIVLFVNVIIHVGAIVYLMYLVLKRGNEEQLEEMQTVIIHRRVPSRIPAADRSKRHGTIEK